MKLWVMPAKGKKKPDQFFSDISESEKWPAAFRGSLFAAIISKQIQYIGFADRRAYSIITINSFLISLALTGHKDSHLQTGILVLIPSALFSIFSSIICLLRKNYRRGNDPTPTLLHFSGIWDMEESEYLRLFAEESRDMRTLTISVARDLYRMSVFILKPKFFWLRLSYFSFPGGYSLGVSLVVINLLLNR